MSNLFVPKHRVYIALERLVRTGYGEAPISGLSFASQTLREYLDNVKDFMIKRRLEMFAKCQACVFFVERPCPTSESVIRIKDVLIGPCDFETSTPRQQLFDRIPKSVSRWLV